MSTQRARPVYRLVTLEGSVRATGRLSRHCTNVVAPPDAHVHAPFSSADRESDPNGELFQVLALCTDEELDQLEEILFGASPLSPLLKTAASGAGACDPLAAH